jgi:flagellar basal body rod protein FlgB
LLKPVPDSFQEGQMIKSLFGPSSITSQLRGGLEEVSATHRAIADRVASATQASSQTGFAEALNAGAAAPDLQQDMAALADTQLRYEADAKLLQAAYGRLRSAIRGHA